MPVGNQAPSALCEAWEGAFARQSRPALALLAPVAALTDSAPAHAIPPTLFALPTPTSPSEARALRRHSALALGVLLSLLLVGFALRVEGGEASLAGYSGPHCLVSASLGDHACPGCGLTRSSALALQGDWSGAASLHPGGFAVVGVFLIWSFLYGWILLRGRTSPSTRFALRAGRYVLAVGIGLGWLLRIS